MTWYQTACLFGFPALMSGAVVAIVKHFNKKHKISDIKATALQLGIQALLRDRLLNEYRIHSREGYASYQTRENFENMYQQYHSLGANGVMDDIRDKFLALPLEKESEAS